MQTNVFFQKLDVVQTIEAPLSSNNKNIDKRKGKKGRRGRKKKETNNPPPPPPPLVGRGGHGDSGSGGININVAQDQVTTEIKGGTSSGSTRVEDEIVVPLLLYYHCLYLLLSQ